ncbi:response regulator transcription factor [Leptogranulimonas caecicola]|mgnify:FL=1|jgi:DNA-binding response OmpR family regulator|uniref:Response regulator transcription factor n=2 Tax=Coriobacteriales TaxID=84999 RepID=A0A4S2F164_9ACTN|nr:MULTISPECIES: response regulator transcription factor [Atopobiaceae]MCI8675671.1 response regulator transcription factor [Atopobiaceae bacterium]TGY62077.1 response regulator transcription factor [Muricaecibacterium torontonense]BCV18809.1 transcriptional regulatory protein DltR [Atopobiaceae bacterium P1]BDC91140.1 transcriptional regulatory protein DltR [Leptogranulimonas caecicola]
MNILVVEDEKNLNDAMCHILNEDGYHTKAAYDGKTGYELARTDEYDVIILDVMLPAMDGFEVVHQLRRDGNATPVIIVTAKTSTTDKIEGLDCGADDYMTKPIDTDELLARIRAISRRKGEVPIDEMKFGDLTLDLHTHDLCCSGREVHLSQKEYEVMRMLMSSTGRVISKHDLLTSIWGTEGDTSENSAEAYISFLRKKLSHLNSEVQITTLRMLGYRLEELG